jgi:surfeit locus 1 family protein
MHSRAQQGKTRGTVTILVVALVVAAGCARLGIWQLSRLRERQMHNRTLLSRMASATVPAASLPPDTGAGHYRLALASGAMDYTREIAWAPRMRRSSPGVNFFTPMRLANTDTVLVVNRGWAYSPDAKSVSFPRWREKDSIDVRGYVETWTQDCLAGTTGALPSRCGDSATRVIRKLDRKVAERLIGAPVAPYILMQTSDSTLRADSIPARVEAPVLDEGPHRGYALQWFGFAVVAIVGGVAFARRGATGSGKGKND